jgi:hypothetical protein
LGKAGSNVLGEGRFHGKRCLKRRIAGSTSVTIASAPRADRHGGKKTRIAEKRKQYFSSFVFALMRPCDCPEPQRPIERRNPPDDGRSSWIF